MDERDTCRFPAECCRTATTTTNKGKNLSDLSEVLPSCRRAGPTKNLIFAAMSGLELISGLPTRQYGPGVMSIVNTSPSLDTADAHARADAPVNVPKSMHYILMVKFCIIETDDRNKNHFQSYL